MSDPTIQRQLTHLWDTDVDPQETAEWQAALHSLLATHGPARVGFMLDQLTQWARDSRIDWRAQHGTPYVNSIAPEQQPAFTGDLAIEEKLASIMRWNALAMVVRANQAHRGGAGCLNTEMAWISGALRV